MVKTWNTGPGDDFACPHCGAEYEVTISRFPLRDSDSAECDVCEKTMNRWNSTSVPSYKLKKRPDGQ